MEINKNSVASPLNGSREAEGEGSFDLSFALRQVGGDKVFYQELLNDFLSQFGNISAEIETALVAGNIQEARRLLHGVTGVAANLGLQRLSQIGRELTAALRQEEPWQNILARFAAEMAQLTDKILNCADIFAQREGERDGS